MHSRAFSHTWIKWPAGIFHERANQNTLNGGRIAGHTARRITFMCAFWRDIQYRTPNVRYFPTICSLFARVSSIFRLKSACSSAHLNCNSLRNSVHACLSRGLPTLTSPGINLIWSRFRLKLLLQLYQVGDWSYDSQAPHQFIVLTASHTGVAIEPVFVAPIWMPLSEHKASCLPTYDECFQGFWCPSMNREQTPRYP